MNYAKTYNVRDDSSWDTLKKRLHERLDVSKNIVLFLSSNTKNSQALREEIDYGINTKGLPVIVIYPDFKEKSDIWGANGMKKQVTDLWDELPIFRDSIFEMREKVAEMAGKNYGNQINKNDLRWNKINRTKEAYGRYRKGLFPVCPRLYRSRRLYGAHFSIAGRSIHLCQRWV